MATEINKSSFNSLYKDDFSDSANYYRVLFNSGRALQARELTQLQTIIQSEVSRFGRNIFREGAAVEPGGVTCNNTIEFIKLNTSTNALPSNPKDLIGKTLSVKAPDPLISVKVIDVLEATGSDPATLYVEYINTSAASTDTTSTAIRVPVNSLLEVTGYSDLRVASANATGQGIRISTASGVYFTQGRFVQSNPQTIFFSKYTNTESGDIGFKISETIVDAEDDISLYDNQGDTPNLAAPGADRYKIDLVLSKRDDLQPSDNFVYIARVVDGRIIDIASGDDAYNKIADLIALRTKEESGNYVTRPFIAKFDNLNDSELTLNVSGGTAYVDGYRLDIPQSKITVEKAQSTATLTGQNIVANYGNYIVGNASNNVGLPDITAFELVTLKASTNFTGSTIGTARVRAIQEDGSNHNYYLFDIKLNAGQNFRDVRSFGSSTRYVNVVTEGGIAKLKNTGDNSLLFPLPNSKPSADGVNITALTIQKKYSVSGTLGGTTSISAGTGLTFTDAFDWVITDEDGAIYTAASYSNIGSQVTISGLNTAQYELYAYVTKSSITHKVKTGPTEATITKSWPSDAVTEGDIRYIDLGYADIYKVDAIKLVDSDGSDISENFIIDNGQRDNFYAKGRIIEKGGITVPSSNIYVKFRYFSHGTGGDFFSVNSYETAVNYNDIPKYTKSNGETISLAEVLDFRPVQDTNGVYTNGTIFPLPQSTDTITGSIEHYLPRKDRLVAQIENSRDGRNGRGTVDLIKGIPSENPQFPQIPIGSIPLYDISLNAYTLNESDLTTSFYSNKRYTMQDISLLEQRIDRLQELTTLSLLELNTQNIEVLDSNGLARTKSGFLADNFANYDLSATDDPSYNASIDPTTGLLTPNQYSNNVNLFFDSNNVDQSGVTLSGDLITLEYSEEQLVYQDLASEAINVNPFQVITSLGHIELSPSSDSWVETQYAPDKVVDGGTVTQNTGERRTTTNLNSFRNSWFGNRNGNEVQIVTGSRVLKEIVGDRVISIQLLPWMRSVKVGFRAHGLRPNTRHFPFFGGVSISDWTREESSFIRFSSNPSNLGNTLTNATTHPDGAQALVSNDEGVIEGSFIVPSTRDLRFRAGTEVFKLLDISVNDETKCTSKAKALFASQGQLETRQRTVTSTRQLDLATLVEVQPPRDPLAQTFRIDQFENPRGIFLTKVDLFFKTKSATVPVSVEIRPVENGIPTYTAIPGAVKYVSHSEVNLPVNTNSLTEVRNAPTSFEFDEPIYLAPGQEYAVVVLANSVDYNVYCAKTYDFVLGTTAERISRQPTLGTLLQSQNASTWTPDQSRDLMFKLHRAEFTSSGTAYLNNMSPPRRLLGNNPFLTTNGDSAVRVYQEGHGFMVNDRVLIQGLSPSTSYGGIQGQYLNGTRRVLNVDHTGYTFGAEYGQQATSTIRTGGNDVTVSQNAIIDAYVPTLETIVTERTTLNASAKFTSATSFAGVGGNGRNLATDALAYGKDTQFSDITLNEINYVTSPKLIASDSNETVNNNGDKSLDLKLALSTTDPKVSPVIDLQRATISTFENIIDFQDSATSDSRNIPIQFVDETHPTSGSSPAKHITKQVTLTEDAVGLKILFAANRPANSDFSVYYRTSQSDVVLDDVSWVYADKVTDLPADDVRTTYREYEYLPGGIGGSLLPFTKFQVKIVFHSLTSSQSPSIRDLRVIALVT